MNSYLLCATPVYGHVAPMLTVGQHLVERGHHVRMLTGHRFAGAVTAAGMEHITLPAECDYDDRDLVATSGEFDYRDIANEIRRRRSDIENKFITVMPHQYRALRAQLAVEPADAVLVETLFTGVIPLMLEKDTPRPPVLSCGVAPLMVYSRDTPPFGPGLTPVPTVRGRFGNWLQHVLVTRGMFGSTQRLAQRMLAELHVDPIPGFVLYGPSLVDHILQLTCPGFEYPRSDLPTELTFTGPVLPPAADFDLPDWWSDLDGKRPVVHVTQGTFANHDLDLLVGPTLEALADRDVLVVATTGDAAAAEELAARAPANARVAAFLPYAQLLPKVNAMVTNGGYGGVQFALAHGVPLVVAGRTEEKPEIAARVAWSGVGIDLKTGAPSVEMLRSAVDRVIGDVNYRIAADRLREQCQASTPLLTIERALDEAVRRTSGDEVARASLDKV